MLVLLCGTTYPNGTLYHYSKDKSRSDTLRASKQSCFNEHNCKSGRHNRMRREVSTLPPTSVHCKAHKIFQRVTSIDLLDYGLQVKTRNAGEYKVPPPRILYWMICAISRQKDAEHRKLTGATQPLLPPEEPNLCDNFISKETRCFDRFHLNFPQHCVFGHILLDSDSLNYVDSWKEVV